MPSEHKIRLTRIQGRGVIEVFPSDITGKGYAEDGTRAILTLRPGALGEGGLSPERVTVEESPAEVDWLMRRARGS